MDLFGAGHTSGEGSKKVSSLQNLSHIFYKSDEHSFIYADISIFFPRKSVIFVISKNTDENYILMHNF